MILLVAIHLLLVQAALPHVDCLPYKPQTLIITYQEMMDVWLLSDGHSSMQMFQTERDAKNGLALASRYGEQCFIGRHASTRSAGGPRLLVTYWTRTTGKQTRVSPETCESYVGAELRAEDRGTAGWLVTDGKSFRIPLDNGTDADAVMSLARQYTSHCIIGSADPPAPLSRVDYWK